MLLRFSFLAFFQFDYPFGMMSQLQIPLEQPAVLNKTTLNSLISVNCEDLLKSNFPKNLASALIFRWDSAVLFR